MYHYGHHFISGWWNEAGKWDGLCYMYHTSEESFLIQHHPVTRNIIYRGGMGANCFIREGYGVEFDAKTGVPVFFGIYVNNKLIRIYQRFRDNKVMFEYEYEDDATIHQLEGEELFQYVTTAVDVPRITAFMGQYIEEDGWFVKVEEETDKVSQQMTDSLSVTKDNIPAEQNHSTCVQSVVSELVPPATEFFYETPSETPYPGKDAEGSVYSFDESLEDSDLDNTERTASLSTEADDPPKGCDETVYEAPEENETYLVSFDQVRLDGFDPETMQPEVYSLDSQSVSTDSVSLNSVNRTNEENSKEVRSTISSHMRLDPPSFIPNEMASSVATNSQSYGTNAPTVSSHASLPSSQQPYDQPSQQQSYSPQQSLQSSQQHSNIPDTLSSEASLHRPCEGYFIRSEQDYANLSKKSKAVVVEDTSCNERILEKIEFVDSTNWEELWIGRNSLLFARELNVFNLPNLRHLVLSDGCMSGDMSVEQNRSVSISELNELEEIVIGQNVARNWENFCVLSRHVCKKVNGRFTQIDSNHSRRWEFHSSAFDSI